VGAGTRGRHSLSMRPTNTSDRRAVINAQARVVI
jgi:hypothetical protein